MSNQIDKLFSDKLSGHTMPPSANAWSKVEANLSKKNKIFFWYRLAAAILLPLVIGGSAAWFTLRTDETKTMALDDKPKNNRVEKKQQQEKAGKSEQKSEGKKQTETVPRASGRFNSVSSMPPGSTIAANTPSTSFEKTTGTGLDLSKQNNNPVTDTTGIIKEAMPERSPATALAVQHAEVPEIKAEAAKKERPMVVEYTIGSSENIAAAKPAKGMTVTVTLKEKTRFQKVVELAGSEGPFAALREVKDDLFAFNFKKDKTKNK